MKTLPVNSFSTYDQLSQSAAEQVCRRLSHGLLQNDHFSLGLSSGSTPVGMYTHLIRMMKEDSLDLSNLYTFNLDEYYPISQTHPRSYRTEMNRIFWEPLHKANSTFLLDHAHILNGEAPNAEKECSDYEDLIKEHGGIDLQILGLGVNGHIAFNEPGSSGDTRTRKIQINEETIKVNSRFFQGNEDRVPTEALTLGIGTILESKEIFLLVHGDEKEKIFEKLITLEEPTPEIPASFLLTHPQVTIFSDLH
jgi:glucosamine-6-phosphate deaminase